jgi:hypothetical protein
MLFYKHRVSKIKKHTQEKASFICPDNPLFDKNILQNINTP